MLHFGRFAFRSAHHQENIADVGLSIEHAADKGNISVARHHLRMNCWCASGFCAWPSSLPDLHN